MPRGGNAKTLRPKKNKKINSFVKVLAYQHRKGEESQIFQEKS